MRVQLSKWGNSLAVRIPATYAREIGAAENCEAELSVENGRLVLEPVRALPQFDLAELVAKITDQNRHEEISTGEALGEEYG